MLSKLPIKTFALASLGCRTNHYETQSYRTQLLQLGLEEIVSSSKDSSRQEQAAQSADLCIVNTCTVTASADAHSRRQIRLLAKKHPHAQIWVTGCLAERDPQALLEMPHVRAVVSNLDKEALLSYIFPEKALPPFKVDHYGGTTRSFVKVQDGCNSFCSYCIIPYVRGRSRSKALHEVEAEVRALVKQGVQEIVLTGINLGDYLCEDPQSGQEKGLADLVRSIDQIEGLSRLRLSSIDPDEVDEALLAALLEGKRTTRSMHIVLQSGSNVVLKRMRRKYTRQIFLQTCKRLKEADPEFTFTTDVIVGFPGESEEDFAQTMQVIEQVGFAKVHMFPYSKRAGTRAARFQDELPEEVITQRKRLLLQKAEEVAFRERSGYVGKTFNVLIEQELNPSDQERLCLQAGLEETQDQIERSTLEEKKRYFYAGHSSHFFYVQIVSRVPLKSNVIYKVEIQANYPDGLFGEAILPLDLQQVGG